ncbi:prepilin peptidase [Streptomyces humidus]|uniref:Prepilin peptidase n=1 Tax=Streptomyces humidus TaxID=52259 RepID=A0A918L6L5_9ACTN|nr:A24 family peptidase [Streptomyces humidus]GGS12243.1 prepilin peptidase [Streptomyces humidus]
MSTPPDALTPAAVAALWGAVTGALLPRAAYRFSTPWEEADGGWRTDCPAGHPVRGWLGRARCPRCSRCAEPDAPRDTPATAHPACTSRPAPAPASPTPPVSPPPSASPRAPAPPAASTAHDGGGAASRATHGAGRSYAPGGVLLPLLTAVVCAALALATGIRPELAVWLALAPVGVLLGVVDVRVRRLPDPLTLPFAAAALALLGPAALLPEHAGDWTTALPGALALGAGYLVLHLVNPGGMAFGDVKLALGAGAVLGWYGWPTVMLGTFAAFLSGALYGGALVLTGRAGRKTLIPFGPFMLVGTLAGLLIGAYAA